MLLPLEFFRDKRRYGNVKQRDFLRITLFVIIAAVLVGIGAGYAQEYYQGRGDMVIDSDYVGLSAGHVQIVISDGDVGFQKDVEATDGGLVKDVYTSASGSNNSSWEVIVLHNGSVSSVEFAETGDIQMLRSLESEGHGLVIDNVFSDNYIYRSRHIILLSSN